MATSAATGAKIPAKRVAAPESVSMGHRFS